MSPQTFDPGWVAPAQSPFLYKRPIDFVEPGAHPAWIVWSDPHGPEESESQLRRMLHFGVTEEEWRQIHADVLHAGDESGASTGNAFPHLSSIDPTDGAYFERGAIEALFAECLGARSRTTSPLAIRGLDKLILLCRWADHLSGDLYLQGQ